MREQVKIKLETGVTCGVNDDKNCWSVVYAGV